MWRHWYRASYWRWWWQVAAGRITKATLVFIAAALGGFAGYAAAGGLFTSAHAAGAVQVVTVRSVEVRRPVTVKRVVTVRENGRIVRKLVPVVRVVARRQTVVETTFRTNNQVRTVTAAAPLRPPEAVAGGTVTVREPGSTVVVTRIVSTTPAETKVVEHRQTVTTRQLVANQHTVTANRTVTAPADAVTVTRTATQTETQSQTVPGATVLRTTTQSVPVTTTVTRTTTTQSAPVTNTVTRTTTQTVPITTTVPQTITVTRTATVILTSPITITQTVTVTTTGK
jgi:hypothetical protein